MDQRHLSPLFDTQAGFLGSQTFVASTHNSSRDVQIGFEMRNITTFARLYIGHFDQFRPRRQSVIESFGSEGGKQC